MHVAARPYVMAGAMLAATSLVAVTPVAQWTIHRPTLSIEIQLADSSIVNIPFNLLQAMVDIPNSEINAVTYAAESLFNSGRWFVVSNTNLWGVDPRDPGHFMSVTNFLVPFEGLGGFDPTGMSANFATLIEDLTAAWVPDLATSALSVFERRRDTVGGHADRVDRRAGLSLRPVAIFGKSGTSVLLIGPYAKGGNNADSSNKLDVSFLVAHGPNSCEPSHQRPPANSSKIGHT
jgi:hypothetical protein